MNKKGFTLVELIAVITILGILAIITTPAYDTISKNIKTRNYNSKKSVIEKQVIEYVELYLKDEVYGGIDTSGNIKNNVLCFSPQFLIQNGIISSDDNKEEYIENDINKKRYKGTEPYISISYNILKEDGSIGNLKLKATFIDDEGINNINCDILYK